MKIVLAPDSFKGSLSASALTRGMADLLHAKRPDWQVLQKPLADGGEGVAEALLTTWGGAWKREHVHGPLPDQEVEAGWAWFPERKLAVIEMATAAGLPLVPTAARNPMRTTTYGVGQLLDAACREGAQEIWMGVGGSATVDGGAGAATACGWQFLDARGVPLPQGGGALETLQKIVPPDTPWDIPMKVLCDVDNPLVGPRGAARVFAPQKGATPDQVEVLEAGLEHLGRQLEQVGGNLPVCALPGGGAAGGLAAGATAFFGAELVSGIQCVMEAVDLRGALQGADWVITGEGQLDATSLGGKVVSGVLNEARAAGVRVAAIVGGLALSEPEWRKAGFEAVHALRPDSMPLEEALRRTPELLEQAVKNWIDVVSA